MLFFLLVLASINGIFINNLRSLNAFLSGFTMSIRPGALQLLMPGKGSQSTVQGLELVFYYLGP